MNEDPNQWPSAISSAVREAALELLLSEDPKDKRRIDDLETLSRKRGLSFEQLVTEALYRYIG